jgi:hypothetical protein
MGLLLVATGAGLLLDRFYHPAAVDISLKWWPLLFIFLGLEVLWQNKIKKDENSKIKYDIFSIIIILLIVTSGLGLQAFSQIGLVEQARASILSRVFAFEDSTEIPLETGIQKIILTTGDSPVVIHTTQGNSIIINSTLQARAGSQAEAEATAAQFKRISSQRSADVDYITLHNDHGMSGIVNTSYTLVIPEQVDVEIDAGDSSLDLNIASLQHDWEIKGTGECNVQLPEQGDATINAWMENENGLYGNLTWNKSETRSDVKKADDNPETVSPNMVQAQCKLGNGTHKINILGMHELTLNSLP